MNLLSKIVHYFLLTVLIIITNIGLAQKYFNTDQELAPDPTLYYEIAKSITQGETFVEHYGFDIGALMAPGFSFLLAGFFKLFGTNVVNVFYLNILFHIISALMLFYLVKEISNIFIGWCFSLWLLFYYQIWRMNFQVMMEISTLFFLVLLLFFIYKYIESNKIWYLLVLSIVFGLLIFLNNRFIFHFLILLISLAGYSFFKSKFRNTDLLLFGLIVFAVLLPWHIRQYIVYDKLVIFSPGRTEIIQSSVKSFGSERNMGSDKILTYEEYLKGFETIGGMTESRMVSIRGKFTVDKYNKLATQYQKRYSKKINILIFRLVNFWEIWHFDFSFKPGGYSNIIPPARLMANLANITFLVPMFLFFPIGLLYSIQKKQIYVQIICVLILSHWALHSIVHYIPRYRIPILPLIFMVAWYGIFELNKGILHNME